LLIILCLILNRLLCWCSNWLCGKETSKESCICRSHHQYQM